MIVNGPVWAVEGLPLVRGGAGPGRPIGRGRRAGEKNSG